MDRRQRERDPGSSGSAERDYVGHDPIQASWSQTRRFNLAWFRNGESLTLVQRAGFALRSLLFFAFGLYLLSAFAGELSAGNWIFVFIFGGATILCLVVASRVSEMY